MQTEIAERFLELPPERQEAVLDELTPAEQAALDQALDALLRPRFVDFVRTVNPSLLKYEHVPRLCRVLQRVADGDLRRVMLLMPPRYFKSELVSRLFSAYYVTRYPKRWAGITSYGARLAWELNGEARTYYQQYDGATLGKSQSVQLWETGHGGGVWAAGAGGPLLGRGYHLGIIDDPIKPEDALSDTYQKKFERWYPSTFLSREEPGAAIVLVMQRLSSWDPVYWLWEREMTEEREGWHVALFDEIRSLEPLTPNEAQGWTGEMGLPPSCTLEPDPRDEGEVLAPSRFSLAEAEAKQRRAGALVASAQRQQRPSAPTGDFWRKEWFVEVYDDLPDDAYNGGRSWDTAYTEKRTNAASATVKTYRGRDKYVEIDGHRENHFPIYVDEVDWDWLEEPELIAWIKSKSSPHYVEGKATGKSIVPWLRRANIIASTVEVEGSKFQRATSVQHVASAGRIHVRRSVLKKLLEGAGQGLLRVTAEALLSDTGGLDLNDAFVQELQRHTGRGSLLIGPD